MMNFLRDENGQGMVEYGLILALIAVAAIAVLGGLGTKVRSIFQDTTNGLNIDVTTGSAVSPS